MESWRLVWRDGFVPVISTTGLEALRERPARRRPAAHAGQHHHPAAADVRAGLAGRGRVCPRLLRLAGRRPGDGRPGRGVLRPPLLRGRSAARRTGRLPLVPQLVRRHAARRDAARTAAPRSNWPSPSGVPIEPASPTGRNDQRQRPRCRGGVSWAQFNPDSSNRNSEMVMIVTCRHCAKSKVNRPRGLCWSCYYTPGVKELYPSTSKYARRGVGNFTGNAPLPPVPTTAAPGTPEKLAVLEQRAKHEAGDLPPGRRALRGRPAAAGVHAATNDGRGVNLKPLTPLIGAMVRRTRLKEAPVWNEARPESGGPRRASWLRYLGSSSDSVSSSRERSRFTGMFGLRCRRNPAYDAAAPSFPME